MIIKGNSLFVYDYRDTGVVPEDPEMEDVVSEPDEAAREEAERLAKEEEERLKVWFT